MKILVNILLVLSSTLVLSPSLFGQTLSGTGTQSTPYYGTLTTSQTVGGSGTTIYFGDVRYNEDVTVSTGGHLTISEGTTIIFTEETSDLIITNTGRITADGTSSSMITFTKASGNDNWGHISFENMTTTNPENYSSLFDYCLIEYGDVSSFSAPKAFGGAFYIDFDYLTIRNCSISNNKAGWGGGIVIDKGSNPEIINTKFFDNYALQTGGAILVRSDAAPTFSNLLIYNNICGNTIGGGGIMLAGDVQNNCIFYNSTIVSNTSGFKGNNITFFNNQESTNAKFINCIIWGSVDPINYYQTSSTSSDFINCAISNFTVSGYTNCIALSSTNYSSTGPQFENPDNSNFQIRIGSPCRDNGDDTYAPTNDFDGNSRINTSDIGAYEVQYKEWTGATSNNWQEATNWSPSGIPSTGDDVVITSTSQYPAGFMTFSVRDMALDSGTSISLQEGHQGTITGILTNNGTIYLNDFATSGIYSLDVDTILGTGSADVDYYLAGGSDPNMWHYISSPLDNISASTFVNSPSNLATYDESLIVDNQDNGWIASDGYIYSTGGSGDGFTTLENGKGYNLWYGTNKTYNITGTLNSDASYIMNLAYNSGGFTENSTVHGYNLLGNPYPCTLDWDVIRQTLDSNIDDAIYFTKEDSYRSYVGGLGSHTGVDGNIPPTQGFFVKTNASGTSVTISNAAKKHSSQTRYKSSTTSDITFVRLKITYDTLVNESTFRLDHNATPDFDRNLDAYAFMIKEGSLTLWSELNDIKYSINSVPFPEDTVFFSLAFTTPASGQFKIGASTLEGVNNYDVSIIDTDENNFETFLINGAEYVFSSEEGRFSDRFLLKVSSKATGLHDIVVDKMINIYSFNNILYIRPDNDKWSDPDTDLRIYDLMGRLVKSVSDISIYNGETKEIPFSQPEGVYIIELSGNAGRVVQKISKR